MKHDKGSNQRPPGMASGFDMPDKGSGTGVTDTYGGNINTGFNKSGIGDTGSDPAEKNRPICQETGKC